MGYMFTLLVRHCNVVLYTQNYTEVHIVLQARPFN